MKLQFYFSGLFKIEWSGDGVVALNSKTYYCFGSDKDKFSAKGVNRGVNNITAEMYKEVLRTKTNKSFVNRGFMRPNGDPSIHTYEMIRNGLTWFYGKRKVLPDGISTVPLDI